MDGRRDGNKTYCYIVSDVDTPSLSEATEMAEFHSIITNPRPHSDFEYLPDTVLYLPAVLDGCKPGATGSIRTADIPRVEDYSEILQSLGLHHRIVVNHDLGHTVFRFTDDEGLLNSIGYEAEDEVYGQFLGVPEEDNKWYDEDDMPSIDKATPILDYLGLRQFQGIKYARLVSWICRPNLEGLERTVNIGSQYYNLALRLESDYGYNRPLDWCRDEFERLEAYWY